MTDLIYIHKNYSWYLPLALLNGRKFCAGKVHFIGDPFGCWVARLCGATAWPMKHFSTAANEFAKIYRHHSELGVDFELFCIQRWFVLAEFMEVNGLETCTYLDTDVLLTQKLNNEQKRTSDFGLTYTGYSAHVCFVNRQAALQQFCNSIRMLYTDPGSEERFQKWHQQMLESSGGGGVSDMTLFYWFQKEHPEVLGDYPTIF